MKWLGSESWVLVLVLVLAPVLVLCSSSSMSIWVCKVWRMVKKDEKMVENGGDCVVPRGSCGWPLIGETLEFIASGFTSRPVSFMEKRKSLYGDVFRTHILGKAIIVSTDPEVNKVILHNHGNVFVPCYPKTITELLGKSSILQINGPLHKRVHSLIGSFLKSPHFKSRITRDIEKTVKVSLSSWSTDKNCQVLVQDETKKAKKKLLKMVNKIVDERKGATIKPSDKSPPNDAIDVLLCNINELSDEMQHRLPLDFISGNIIEMMIPGEETVPTAMALAVKFLVDSPVALAHLVEENMELKKKKVLSCEEYSWTDYMSLPFTQNVISETLRLANIINAVWRKALKDVRIKGYLIPKGWCVLASFSSVHMDEKNYENPYEFNPWRWKGMGNASNIFTPFGGGQRLCPGLELSRLEISIFLHHLVTTYEWVAEADEIIYFPTVKMKRRLPVTIKSLPAINVN